MRLIVMFDLPTLTSEDRRAYAHFHKFLLKSGFLMLQESVYCKLALNATVQEAIAQSVRTNKPRDGSVFMLTVTEKQFSKMEILVGSLVSETLNSVERVVYL